MSDAPEESGTREPPFSSSSVLRELVPHPYQSLNEAGEIVAVNDAWLETLGYERAEVEGERFADFLAAESRYRFESPFEEFESAGTDSGVELEMRHADGGSVVASYDVRIEYDAEGNARRAHCQFDDVSERKRREEQLAETNTVLATLLENLPMGVLAENPDREIIAANEMVCDIFEMSVASEELIGRDCAKAAAELKHRFGDPEGFVERIDELVENRELVLREKVAMADGRTLERSYVPYSLPDGEATLWLYRDVTERVERERELERHGAYLEQSHDVITVVNADGTVKFQTESTERITGFSPDDVNGETGFDYVHPEDREKITELFASVVERPEAEATAELRVETTDGDWRWLEARAVNKLADPVVDGIVVSSRDVTERKEREGELRRQNDRLGEFASVISHDLRSPLSVAQGRAALAQEECESAHLEPLVNALNRMEEIVEDTLTLARQGQKVGEMEWIGLPDLIGRCWGMVDTRDAHLEFADEISIRGDRNRLQHVFENLFRNAVEHGGEDVTVRVGRVGEDAIYLEDDGPGIPADRRENVFEPGYSSASEGTGFGLAIVRRIAEAHGWTVEAIECDGGARFEFSGVDIEGAEDV